MTTQVSTENFAENTIVTYSEWSDSLIPKISNVSVANSSYSLIDDTAVSTNGGYVVITGTGFEDGATVIINEVTATAVSYINATRLNVQLPAKSAATYDVYVVNPDGATAIGVNKITYSDAPIWVTDTTLTEQFVDAAFNITFNATGATSYSNTTSLPTGTTLLSNGYFYGTITGIVEETTYNFTIRATDGENQDSDKNFSLTVAVVLPKAFNISPTYNGQSTWNLETDGPLNITSGSYTITPTSSFTCNVKMWGAGGNGGRSGTGPSYASGAGAALIGTLSLNSTSNYYLTFFGAGSGSSTYNGNGGSAAGIFSGTSAVHGNSIAIAAGGGGGGYDDGGRNANGGAGGYPNGAASSGYPGTTAGGGTQSAGGTAGGGSNVGTAGSALQGGSGGVGSTYKGGGGGGGYYGGGGGGMQASWAGAGGAGGSSYTNPSYMTGVTQYSGSGTTAGNSSDPVRSGAGAGVAAGSSAGATGGPGRIYITV